MSETWVDRLVTASFRSNNFLTESHDAKGGRRLAIKERPGGEEPDVKDLGGKSGEFHLNAYFIGSDYDLFRDAFLLALNTPGADWLVHPWLVNLSDNTRGKFWVRARDWSVHESNDKGGYCTVSIDFVPGGRNAVAPTIDRADAAAASAKNLKDKVQGKFKLLQQSAASLNNFIAKVQSKLDSVRDILALAQLPLTMLNQIHNVIDGIKGDIAELLALPGAYAAQLRSFADLLGLGSAGGDAASAASASGSSATMNEGSTYVDSAASVDSNSATTSVNVATTPYGIPVTGLPQVIDTLLVLTNIPVPMPEGAGDSPALHINLARETALFSQLVLASAVEVALADYQSADDRDAVLASVLKAMDRMLPGMDDDVFQAALDCRATLIDALMAQDLAPATQRDIVSPLPSTLLAHRMEVDEGMFLARNKVRHPLFVQGRVYG